MAAGFQPIEPAPRKLKRWLGSFPATDFGMGSAGSFIPRPTSISEPPLIGAGNFWPGGLVSPNPWDSWDFDANTFIDGIPDASRCVQAAIDAAQAAGGGVVWLPPGIIRINGVTISGGGVWLRGAGWETYEVSTAGTNFTPAHRGKRGTYVLTDSTNTPTITLSPTANHARISDMAFIQVHPPTTVGSSWAPRAYPATIDMNGSTGGNIAADNLLFWGIYQPMLVGSVGPVNQVAVRDITMVPYLVGIYVLNPSQSLIFDGISVLPSLIAGSSNIQRYVYTQGTAFRINCIGRPTISNFTARDIKTGIWFDNSSTDLSQRTLVKDATMENVQQGMTGVTDNAVFSAYGYSFTGRSTDTSQAILIQSSNNRIDVDGLQATRLWSAAVLAASSAYHCDLRLGSNVSFDNYGLGGALAPINVPTPSTGICYVSTVTRFTNGHGGAANVDSTAIGNYVFY